jgi:hypothetical protein
MHPRKQSLPLPTSALSSHSDVLLHDFDAIEEAEDEAVRWVATGHSFDATQQGRKPKS